LEQELHREKLALKGKDAMLERLRRHVTRKRLSPQRGSNRGRKKSDFKRSDLRCLVRITAQVTLMGEAFSRGSSRRKMSRQRNSM
jgi:hypothetical protein